MTGLKKSAMDLVACENEPIDRPQAIQAACALLLFDRETGKLTMGSDNLEPLFGRPLSALLGAHAEGLFEARDAAALNDMMSGDEKTISRYLQLRDKREHLSASLRQRGIWALN